MTPYDGDVPLFLLVAPAPLLAADIGEAIRGALPAGCRVESVRDAAAAALWLATCGRLSAAFLTLPEEVILTFGLDRAVRQRGGKVVAVSGSLSRDRAQAHGWELLLEPFTGDMVETVIRDVMRSAAA